MRLTDIYERGSSLQKLLSTLKLNRERVPLETLNSVYRVPYEELKAQIRESVQEFVLLVACRHLLINPDFSLDEQTAEKVGSRHGKPVIYKVKSGEMYRRGFRFYRSVNGVWLTIMVPVEYLEKI